MVSVLMCTYNREKYLKRAIDSVLFQTYGDLEFIIVDDGSTDGTDNSQMHCTERSSQEWT